MRTTPCRNHPPAGARRLLRSAAALFLLLAAAHPSRAETDFWTNTGQELLGVAASPLRGSAAGYLTAATFGAAVYASLQNDLSWYETVQRQRSDWQDQSMPVITLMGDGFVQVAGLAALYQYGGEHDRQIAGMALEGQLNVAVVSLLLKQIFRASRPASGARTWFASQLGDTSFPSGHSMSAFATAVILGEAYRLEWLTYPLAALVAYSRVYHQAHWPADVIAGAGLGILIGHTVLAYHAGLENQAFVISTLPRQDGGLVVMTWNY